MNNQSTPSNESTRPVCQFCKLRPVSTHKTGFRVSCRTCRRKKLTPTRPSLTKGLTSIERSKIYRAALRLEVLKAYTESDGVIRCACPKCPERLKPVLAFLELDHIDGDGAKHRRSINANGTNSYTVYKALKDAGYPPGYQILCKNCNGAKSDRKNFRCPHEDD